ncbi:hypothetical protein KAX97_14580, partial [candidate division WOR-3 bacterium]|nr:hypothetical protein [candidate division WOR-3 bacterium]
VGTLSNTFPRGYYEFDIAPSFLNYATAGIAENKYTLDTNMPGSYYTPLSNVRVVICVDEINLYICAESEEQAYDIAWNAPYIHKSSGSIMVNILSPRKGSTISLNQPTLIKAEVLGDSEGEKNCRVNATFSCSDEVIALVDNGLHGDGQADDGVYANTWTPEKAGICEITVTACNCIAEGSDTVNVTTFMFLNLTNYVAAQYNPELRTLNISAIAISPLHGKITSGVATYKILYGNDSFTGIAGNLAYNSISGYWEANNVDVGDLSEGDYKANVTIISTLTGEYGTGEAIFVISAGYGSIYGYVINGTMYPEEIVTIPDAAVSLYDSNTYYSLSPTPIATTTTNFTGGLVFENVAPGYYILNATAPHNYSGITPAFRVGSEKVHGDIIVYKTEYLSMLNEHMGNLYEQCKNVIDYETHLMAGISERFPEDIGANQSVWWMVIDFTGDVLAGGPTKLSKALIDHRIVKKHFYKEFGRAILHTTKRKLLRKTIPLDMVKYTVGYVVNYKWSRTFNDLKELDIYNNIQNNLDYQYLSFISSSRNIPVSHNFDFSDAKRVISSQTVQLSQITGEGSTIMVPADVDKPVRSFLLKGACGGYNLSAAFTNALGAANKGLSLVQIGAGGAALVLAPTGVGGGAAATLAVGASGVKMVTSALETVMMVITAQSGASAVSRWIGDLCNVPATYSDTSILLIRESSSPYYLNKSNTFNAVADINLNPTFTLPGDINVLKAPMLPPFPGMAIGQATGNIKNTGNIKSNLTVVSQVIWNYKVPPILDLFTGGVKEIPLIMSGFHHREDMPPNVQFSINIPYCGLYIDPLNMFNPHIMSINVFSGPFCVDQKTFYYYVIDPENGTVNARTSTGMMTLEQYAKFLPNETKVI